MALGCPLVTASLYLSCQSTGSVARQKAAAAQADHYGMIPEVLLRNSEDVGTTKIPRPGRYLGYVALISQKAKIAVQMDLVLDRVSDSEIKYQAIMKFFAGDFYTSEYVTTFFQKVTYQLKDKRLDFGTTESISLGMVASTARGLSAIILVAGSDETGDIDLRWQRSMTDTLTVAKNIFANVPVLDSLSGRYVGDCLDDVSGLEIQASKWRGAAHDQLGNPFSGYRINGRLVAKNADLCSGEAGCTKAVFSSGAYNFISGQLTLLGDGKSLQCKRDSGGLNCDSCLMKKVATIFGPLKSGPVKVKIATRPTALVLKQRNTNTSAIFAAGKLSGHYYGYLHHELTNQLQLVSINLKASGVGETLTLGGVATLYFGLMDSNEFIAYKLPQVSFEVGKSFQFLSGSGDLLLALKDVSNGVIKGEWFSKNFGRVGTIELQRDFIPPLSRSLKASLMQPLAGKYSGAEGDYEVIASAEVSEQPDAFYPLKLYGWVKERDSTEHRRVIEAGVYDFFTGSLALRLDDGRIVAGTVDRGSGGSQSLYWPTSQHLGSAVGNHTLSPFKKLPNEPAQQVRLERL
jgi:hypothetical protein